MRVALTVAGSDSGGGAGIQADLKTFHHFGVFGCSALTLITEQNTLGVQGVHLLPLEVIVGQIESVRTDLAPHAIKTGAMGSAAIVEGVAEALGREPGVPLVVDPVLISKHGAPLGGEEMVAAVRDRLLPLATLLTPNLHEAGALIGKELRSLADMEVAARELVSMGAGAVVVKGGALGGGEALDLFFDGVEMVRLSSPRIETRALHGTGCTFSAAITAGLAKGTPLREAVGQAKRWVQRAIETAPGLGAGFGPVNHRATS